MQTQIYIDDTIGELGVFYSLAQIAFIGGSLVANGGQNPIEAIKLNTLVLTGPHYFNQNQYQPLLRAKAVLEVKNAGEIAEKVHDLFENEEKRLVMNKRAQREVDKMSGAQAKTLAILGKYLPEK